ncbi:MAG: DedA family protein [Burkholderiales bacterium]
MELLNAIIDVFVNLDVHFAEILATYGIWVYAILFLIIFCETGLVVTPLLPGDSLLFVVGTFVGSGHLDGLWVSSTLIIAAILGDTVNYQIGKYVGGFLVERKLLIKPKHIEKTNEFFDKYGGKTIVLARFVPIVRTYAPFVAGLGRYSYISFLIYNVLGALLWVTLLVGAGVLFGTIDFVKNNLTAVILLIVFLSIVPALIEFFRARNR